ncbi:MAG: TRAP transporter small permease [Clostridia bacterium]|nr:TRAP transporter small permease [Clostridia bacterium]
MLSKIEGFIKHTASLFNKIAGASIVLAMLLVVTNVLMRAIFKKPILGTYEFTGFLSVLIISFGLAYCLLINAHIAMDFIFDKFGPRLGNPLEIFISSISFAFMSVFTFRIFVYASRIAASNQLSPTTRTPFHIFIYIMGVCFAMLCLVYLIKIKEAVGKARVK